MISNEMSSGVRKDNAQYQKGPGIVSASGKGIRDEAITLTSAGPSPTAKALVFGKCADHAPKNTSGPEAVGCLFSKKS